MKKNIIIKIILSLILLESFSCGSVLESRYNLQIQNNSSANICCYFYLVWEGGDKGVIYPDTLLSFDKTELININSEETFTTSRSVHPIAMWISSLPQDTLSIFIFSKDTLDKYNWSEIQMDYKILQRYDLSSEDFKALSNDNGVPIITYPPTEAMRNMRMYPPYLRNEVP